MNRREAYEALTSRFATLGVLDSIRQVLFWDSQVCLGNGSAATRGEQYAVLVRQARSLLVDPAVGEWLAHAAASDQVEQANLDAIRRQWLRGNAVPEDLAARKAALTGRLPAVWHAARQARDWRIFAGPFAELVAVVRDIGQASGERLRLSPYDALMDEHDPGVSSETIEPLFARLARELPPLHASASDRATRRAVPRPFDGDWSIARQRILAEELLRVLGPPPVAMRLDVAPHPFTMPAVPGDVRITVRFEPDSFRFGVMATLHEAGHALYETQLPLSPAFQPVSRPRGASVHESQSLMLEQQAGRTCEFLTWLAPRLKQAFGGSAEPYSAGNVIAHYRRVARTPIRVDADEIAYPLHVILRYRVEQALLAGALAPADVAGAWSDLSAELLGFRPADAVDGPLQDLHWAMGMLGYFPNYAVGAVLAAQLFAAACDEIGLLDALGRGDFRPYREWTAQHVHSRASRVDFATLVQEATGTPLTADAFLQRLQRRYLDCA